ncbi:DUF397 domain-containing protein [Streptomyces parvus]|uniref:DUF397 domain-containing protein n=1 Tax=Streptomyces parvus TaxID=66428 RepID=A0A7K3S449_9ACTN|nr:DUF397 domain-containing protein [Streptomyces parvus]
MCGAASSTRSSFSRERSGRPPPEPPFCRCSSPEAHLRNEVGSSLAATRGIVPVRDSKAVDGPVVAVPATAFAAFVADVRGGTFDTV